MPKAQSFTIPTQFVRATVQKDSFDPDRGTFDLTFATETPVFRQGWDENYNEVLTCDPANIRLERAAGGLPLLNAHPDYSGRVKPEDVMGKISDIRCENRSLVGTATLGANATPQVRSDIQNGILDSFSVGYNIYKGTRVDMGKDATPTYQMPDWEPNHVAIAPIPADYSSKKRSDTLDGHPYHAGAEIRQGDRLDDQDQRRGRRAPAELPGTSGRPAHQWPAHHIRRPGSLL